ncbi:hypothetical protein [Bythopirellula goksoeyrii]|uniref:PEP-CTERM protein-sorting domain-containing protein n=1 Tax=Bythopirellula goksoeyrii TaxID=1400387 RepID=A0A5B9Q9L0_9BACT|nr:hypothetical protein [Bythopirellula goksoeyrii]QEG34330.1 hypothetical protein Pr1d_16050 [Bythopirellula goksoeyrii]
MKLTNHLLCSIAFMAAIATNSIAYAAELSLGSVDADTFVEFDSNGGIGGTPRGTATYMEVRGGDPFNSLSLTSKSLVRFDLGASPAIDPNLPYFFEVTTDDARNSNDTFRLYSITDGPTQSFNEATFSWEFADADFQNNAPNATAGFDNFLAAGPLVGVFFAPEPSQADAAIGIPILGSDISTFVNGNTFATFGITETETNRLRFNTKENVNTPARLYTFDVVNSQASGNLSSAGAWVGGSPVADNWYKIIGGNTVTVAAGAFAGEGVIVDNGALNFVPGVVVDIPLIQINAGGTLTHSTPGNIEIGDGTLSRNDARFHGGLVINSDLSYTAAAGENLTINLPIRTRNTFTFNGGAGSDLIMRFPQASRGLIQFNGSGDEVVLSEDEGVGGTLEMNSTGGNTLVFDGEDTEQEFGFGTVVFNQPGTIDHRSNTSPKSDRLQGLAYLEVNAPMTLDLTAPEVTNTGGSTGNGRRIFQITRALRGGGDMTVNGTPSAPGVGVGNNSIQIGVDQGTDTSIESVSFSGTMTANNYADIEMRTSMPAAKVVINGAGQLTTGFDLSPEAIVEVGEIQINSGGSLNVGTQPQQLHVVKSGGRTGNLTLGSGSKLTMQINEAEDYLPEPGEYDGVFFDKIEVEGNVILGGTLTIQLNPDVIVPGVSPPTDPQYFPPVLGDTWDIITTVGSPSPADFDGLNGVDSADLAIWQGSYGMNDAGDADGDGDSDGADFFAWQRSFGANSAAGTISGTFSNLIVEDAFGDLAANNLALQINYIGTTTVQIEVVAASALSAVPEPSASVLAAMASVAGLWGRRRSS